MNAFYPHLICLKRAGASDPSLGSVGYRGARRGNETTIAERVPAAIQLKSEAPRPSAELPGDTVRRTLWHILIPRGALECGEVRTWDIIEDELGTRYQVMGPYFTAFGHKLLCERLEV